MQIEEMTLEELLRYLLFSVAPTLTLSIIGGLVAYHLIKRYYTSKKAKTRLELREEVLREEEKKRREKGSDL